jgi:hypothetical protein
VARTKPIIEDTSVVITDADTPGLPAMAEASRQEHIAIHQHEATVRAISAQIGYMLPADCIDADLIQRDIAANMRRSVEACLEVGRGLAVLKAACEHGNFLARLDVLGLDRSVAVRFMQAATKFSNVATNATFSKAIGTQSKLFEMLVLDDEQIEELELTGQTGELKLDDIATMSVKELRAKLREARAGLDKQVADLKADAEATDKILGDKSAKLDQLEREIHKLRNKSGDWHPRVFEISMENTRVLGMAMEALDRIDTLRDVILNEEFGEQDREAAIEMMALVYYDGINQIAGRLAEVAHACDAVFIGYKEKARPILEVFGQQGQETVHD